MNVRILTDSSADVIPAIQRRVYTVPLTVRFGGVEYLDGVTMDRKTFYEKLIENDELPTTSQATPDAFAKEFQAAKEAGDAVVVITISSKLSGTYQSAVIAAEEFDNVYVVDSGTVAMGSGILTELALTSADNGLSAEAIAEHLEKDKKNIIVVALVDTLEYLKKGGRISKAVAFAGSILNMKPVLSLVNGEITLLGKARGSKAGNNLLAQEIQKAGGIDFQKPLLLGYTGISDALLLKYIEDSRPLWTHALDELRYTAVGSAIGTHVGPGAVVVGFFKN